MKRAGLSVCNNLAEGSARKSKVEKNRFYEIARSSVVKIDNCIIASLALGFLANNDVADVDSRNTELFKIISGLMDSNNK
jgi:four helix bundle protein